MDDIRFHEKVIINEVSFVCIVCKDPSNFRSSEEDIIRPFHFEKSPHAALISQIQLGRGAKGEVVKPSFLKLAEDGRANHAAMACDKYFCIPFHLLIIFNNL